MSVIGFNFTKIHVERSAAPQGKVNISNNVAITNVQKADINLTGTPTAGLRFSFAFASKYEPAVGKIELEGEVIVMEDRKVVDETLASWKAKKSVPQALMASVLNTVLNKSNIQALVLSRDLNLPSPIPLPKVNVTPKAAKAAKGKNA